MVKRGKYRFNDLKRIYTISFLAENTYKTKYYHQIGILKNQYGEVMDTQITHIVLELKKFKKKESELETDLDKLLYFMKLTQEVTIKEKGKLPFFTKEQWFDEAIKNLEERNMTPEEQMYYEMLQVQRQQIIMEKEVEIEKGIQKRKKELEVELKKELEVELKKEKEQLEKKLELKANKEKEQTILNLLKLNMTTNFILKAVDTTIEQINSVKQRLNS